MPWSEVTGLPNEQCMTNFLEHLTASDPNKCWTRRDLYNAIATGFDIPATVQEAEGPKSNTPAFATSVSRGVISQAIYGVRHSKDNPFLKRIATACYQHVSGNGVVSKEFRTTRTSNRNVKEAIVSVKILHSLNWDAERVFCELAGRDYCGWTDADIEAAVEQVFYPAV